MSNRLRGLTVTGCVMASMICDGRAATQSGAAPIQLPARVSYAAKFVCGLSQTATNAPPSEPAVKRGNYATELPSDHAMSIDCQEIVNLLVLNGTPPAGTFIEGYVVIDSSFPTGTTGSADLDVVVVTTTATSTTTNVNDHEVVTVTGRRLPAGTWPF